MKLKGIVIEKKINVEVQLYTGLLSDKSSDVADENIEFKKSWVKQVAVYLIWVLTYYLYQLFLILE